MKIASFVSDTLLFVSLMKRIYERETQEKNKVKCKDKLKPPFTKITNVLFTLIYDMNMIHSKRDQNFILIPSLLVLLNSLLNTQEP
jgi:hypothetical protein